ncbi:MAG: peptidylprolyl isomerase [Bermanella sp.]
MLKQLKKYTNEPMLHFLVIGLVLYCLLESFYPSQDGYGNSDKTIQLNSEKLIQFLQFQNKSFNQANAKSKWTGMSEGEKNKLIDDYIREEVMYREAMNLGLEKDDQIIRRRLIQKIEYINRGFIGDAAKIEESEVESFFNDNKDQYTIDAAVTFTHVFFEKSSDKKTHGSKATSLVNTALNTLKDKKIPFEKASEYGQRFFYHRNYVDRTPAFIASHFGEAFSKEVFALKNVNQWIGPITSRYGSHLVMISKTQPERVPQLEEVAGQVLEQLQRIKQADMKKQALRKMITRYQLENNTDVELTSQLMKKEPQEQQTNVN